MEAVNSVNTNIVTQKKPDVKPKNNIMGKDEFLKLFVTQLKHQDPINPVDDKSFIAQMAQFSSLEQLMNIQNSIEKMSQQKSQESIFALLGKNVKVYDSTAGNIVEGEVTEIKLNNGKPLLRIGMKDYSADAVISVKAAAGNNK